MLSLRAFTGNVPQIQAVEGGVFAAVKYHFLRLRQNNTIQIISGNFCSCANRLITYSRSRMSGAVWIAEADTLLWS